MWLIVPELAALNDSVTTADVFVIQSHRHTMNTTRLRGALGIGLTWAVAWGGVGVLVALGFVIATGSRPDPPVPMMFTVAGLLNGVLFSTVVSVAERGRLVSDLRLPRVATAGAAVGVLFATTFVVAVASGGDRAFLWNLSFLAPIFGTWAAGSGAACVLLARRTDRWHRLFAQLCAR